MIATVNSINSYTLPDKDVFNNQMFNGSNMLLLIYYYAIMVSSFQCFHLARLIFGYVTIFALTDAVIVTARFIVRWLIYMWHRVISRLAVLQHSM